MKGERERGRERGREPGREPTSQPGSQPIQPTQADSRHTQERADSCCLLFSAACCNDFLWTSTFAAA